ncbi:hypothetical protein [Allokutzneria albata]|nr:hypothetical protein [Allokutzneria albata]
MLITGGSRGLGAHAVDRLRRDHPELHLVLLTARSATSPPSARSAAPRGG